MPAPQRPAIPIFANGVEFVEGRVERSAIGARPESSRPEGQDVRDRELDARCKVECLREAPLPMDLFRVAARGLAAGYHDPGLRAVNLLRSDALRVPGEVGGDRKRLAVVVGDPRIDPQRTLRPVVARGRPDGGKRGGAKRAGVRRCPSVLDVGF